MSIAAQISIAFVYRLFLDVTWQPIWFKDKSQLDFFFKKIRNFPLAFSGLNIFAILSFVRLGKSRHPV